MKHIYFIASLLRSKFVMNGMRVGYDTPDSQPTVNRRSRLTSQQRHASVTCARVAREWLKYAAMAVMLFTIAVGNVWGEDPYTITFKSGTGSSDGSTAQTTVANIISGGSTYVSSVSGCSRVYNGKSGYGVKLGASSNSGGLTINISSTGQVKPTKITFNAARYGTDGTNLSYKINGGSAQTITLSSGTTFDDYDVTMNGNTTLTSIYVGSASKRIYVKSITVTVGSSTKTYTLKVPNGTGGYATYSSQEQSAMTESTATGGNSCTYGLAGYYSGWREGALETPANSPGTTYNHATASGMPASGTTLYAVFTNDAGKYLTNPLCDACDNGTITYAKGTVPAGGGSITGSHANDTKVCETNLTLPGETFYTTGYTQDGWATSDGGDKAYNLSATTYSTEGNATLYPHWTANEYTVTWSVNGNTSTISPTTNVPYNTTTTAPNATPSGDCATLTFMGWTTAAISGTQDSAPTPLFTGTTPTITADVTYYAVFAEED